MVKLFADSQQFTVATLPAEIDFEFTDASTLMTAYVKIRGEHSIDSALLTLLDNGSITVNCSVEATYIEYSDETILIIQPHGSNSIGGAGSTWEINGAITIDGVEYGLTIKAPEPVEPSIEPTLPVVINITTFAVPPKG